MPHIPNMVTKTLLCIDDIWEADFSGTLYNLYMPEPVVFRQFMEMIIKMEQFFNDVGYPQSFFEDRSFLGEKADSGQKPPMQVQQYHEDSMFQEHVGKIATFVLEVRFRQNASWQGTLTWKEGGETVDFRSTLEMTKLLDGNLRKAVQS